jgi:competence protein ComEC
VAVRGADGRLSVHRAGRDAFAVKEWLAADGDARLPNDKALGQGFRCDDSSCLAKLADGGLVSQVLTPDAFEEDCQRAAVVVSARDAPPDCEAVAIGRAAWRAHGAAALRHDGDNWTVTFARPAGQDRPWAHVSGPAEHPPRTTAQPRDATPRPQDLEAGD